MLSYVVIFDSFSLIEASKPVVLGIKNYGIMKHKTYLSPSPFHCLFKWDFKANQKCSSILGVPSDLGNVMFRELELYL